MSRWSDFKQNIFPQLVLSYCFLVSGLFVNFIELLTLVFIWPLNKNLYRKLNYYLGYSIWSNLTCLAQWWAECDFDFFCADEDVPYLGKESALSLLNHKYDVDWLMGWLLCQRISLLGGCKVFNKDSTKYLPIIGWSFWFNEMLFLKREWESDKKSLVKGINAILESPKDLPYNIGIFSEGTRFTKEKHEASMKIAKEKGLPVLKHHLLPRTKGFNLLVSQVAGKVDALYDITFGMYDVNGRKPNLKDIKDGFPVKFQMYFRRIPISTIPTDNEKECSAWLHRIYKEKDDLFDTFATTGSFAETDKIKKRYLKKNGYDLYIALCWIIIIAGPSFYYLLAFLINGAWIAKLGLIAFFATINFAVKYLMSSIDIKQASSFGLESEKKAK